MPEQFSAKKDRRGQKTRRSHSVRGIQCQSIQGRWGSKDKTRVRTIECQKKAQRESKSKRIGIHTCFQASIETPNLDDVALANYQIQGWTIGHYYQTNLAKVLERVVAHLRVAF